jgi:hypothetical protein
MNRRPRTGRLGTTLQVSKGKSIEITGWIAYLDIFGFGSHLESDFFFDAESKLLAMHRRLNEDNSFRGNGTYFMFSDSVVLWVDSLPGDDTPLRNLIERIATAQKIAGGHGFLWRGSLAYGRILLSSNYILGDAYLRAYRFEANLMKEPHVVIPKSEFEKAGLSEVFASDLEEISLKKDRAEMAMVLLYTAWEQVRSIKAANVAAIMSSLLLDDEKEKLAKRWMAIRER